MLKRYGVATISIICIAACLADLVILVVLGREFPGYSHASDSISVLGSVESPVSNIASAWWIILGIVFIAFAAGFYTEFRAGKNDAVIAAVLIAVYGAGEGLGSGLFRITHSAGAMTIQTIIHDAVGCMGILAILALPLVIRRVISQAQRNSFYRFSTAVFIIGIVSSVLFLLRYTGDNIFKQCEGIWQRITLVNTYIYFVVVSVIMLRRNYSAGEVSE